MELLAFVALQYVQYHYSKVVVAQPAGCGTK